VHEGDRCTIEASSDDAAYLVLVMPYCDRAGLPLGAIITLTDVSESMALRRAAEAALREFTFLADSLEPVVWKRDYSLDRILYVNQRIQELTGWSSAEICASPNLLDDAILPDDQQAVMAARRLDCKGWRVTYRMRLRDGGVVTLQEVARVLDDPNDHAVVGTLSDVTEMRRLERRSQLLASAFQAIQATETQASMLLDDSLCLVTVSDTLANYLGSTGQEMIGQQLESLVQKWPCSDNDTMVNKPVGLGIHHLPDLASEALRSQQPLLGQQIKTGRSDEPDGGIRVELLPIIDGGDVLGVLVRVLVNWN
jgi:two-component system CheB/CheR fusion protein